MMSVGASFAIDVACLVSVLTLHPSRKIARVRTVAVVVPSPAASLVLDATCRIDEHKRDSTAKKKSLTFALLCRTGKVDVSTQREGERRQETAATPGTRSRCNWDETRPAFGVGERSVARYFQKNVRRSKRDAYGHHHDAAVDTDDRCSVAQQQHIPLIHEILCELKVSRTAVSHSKIPKVRREVDCTTR